MDGQLSSYEWELLLTRSTLPWLSEYRVGATYEDVDYPSDIIQRIASMPQITRLDIGRPSEKAMMMLPLLSGQLKSLKMVDSSSKPTSIPEATDGEGFTCFVEPCEILIELHLESPWFACRPIYQIWSI
jgi:hypothetical protein